MEHEQMMRNYIRASIANKRVVKTNGDKPPKPPTPKMIACTCGHVKKTHLQGACLACATCTGYEEEK